MSGKTAENLINSIESKIGNPDKAIALKRDLDLLRVMYTEVPFYIKGVGSSNAYHIGADVSSDKHRFLIKSIENLLDSLVERYLPTALQREDSPKAQRAWALLFLHKILSYNNLGDPRIWDNRDYVKAPNGGLEEGLIFLDDVDYIMVKKGYKTEIVNNRYYFYSKGVTLKEAYKDAIKESSKALEESKESYKVLTTSEALPPKVKEQTKTILKEKWNFCEKVHRWAKESKSKLEEKENAEISK